MENVAMYGSFTGSAAWPGGTSDHCLEANALTIAVVLSRVITWVTAEHQVRFMGSECTAMPSPSSVDWDKQGPAAGGRAGHLSAAPAMPIRSKHTLQNAIMEIVARAASGAAASVLASGQGSGANLVQSIFYPRRSINSQPHDRLDQHAPELLVLSRSKDLRQHYQGKYRLTRTPGGVMELNLDLDKIIHFEINGDQTKARLYDVDANGNQLTTSQLVDPLKR